MSSTTMEEQKRTLTSLGIIDPDETDLSLGRGLPSARPVGVNGSFQESKVKTDDSNRQALGPYFCLNAPRPDDDEDYDDRTAITPNPPIVESGVSVVTNGNSAVVRNQVVPLDTSDVVGITAVSPTPNHASQTTHSEQGQDQKYRKSEFTWLVWAKRHWKVSASFMLLTVLLLISVSLNIIQATDQKCQKNGGGEASGVDSSVSTTSTLKSIRERGYLACGVVEYPGLSSLNSTTGNWQGFEVDLCRAVAAAIFGNGSHVQFTSMTYGERFTVLQSGKVDLLAAGVSYTMERDLYEPTARAGFSFSVPYLYNGLSFAGQTQYVACAEQKNTKGNCSKLTICVQDNTTHVQVVQSLFPGGSVIKLAPTAYDFYTNFRKGYCNVLAGEQFDLAETNVRQVGYTGNYSISNNLYSKEPIALVTRDDDAEWSDFVNWVFLALLTAENRSITQGIAQSVVDNPGPSVDLSQISFYRAVATVGNYAEMYNRHLESIVPRAPVNQQNNGTTPLIYSFPFGNNATVGPGPMANGTLEKILQRGYLRCGTAVTRFFANFSICNQQWEGFDVDYCKALSAAIFNGTGRTVFIPVTGTNRWELLAKGTIDLISWDTTWNYERDVFEKSTKTGFSFTQPDFYTGIQVGGVPPYGECAERVDVLSSNCTGLKICVNNATTTIDALCRLFNNTFIVRCSNDKEVDDCLTKNGGNAIAADGFLTASPTLRDEGKNGSYQEGSKVFTRENLAMVTRQDDPQWSSFVNWVVVATFYAEEQNITQGTYYRMPITNNLGPSFTAMLQNVIVAVGSHTEILARNAKGRYKISAINRLNANPNGPQHFPPGGLFGLY